MGNKAADTPHNIDNASGPGAANERTVQWWFQKFCKGGSASKMRSAVASHQEADKDQWRADQS